MKSKGIGNKFWTVPLAAKRIAQRPVGKADALAPELDLLANAPGNETAARPASFGALVPDKLAHKYGGALLPAAAEIAAIASLRDRLDAWRLKGFERTIGIFYKGLGAALDATPAEHRVELVRSALAALKKLVDAVGTGDLLVAATSSLDGLVNTAVRFSAKKRVKLEPDALAALYDKAGTTLSELLLATDGRAGMTVTLNFFPSLVEQIAGPISKQRPLDAAGLVDIWTRARRFFEDGPKAGLTQANAGGMASAASDALREGGEVRAVFDQARALFVASFQPARDELKAQLAEAPPPHFVGTPSEAAYHALHAALGDLLLGHPTPSPSLVAQIYDTRAALLAKLDPGSGVPVEQTLSAIGLIRRFGPTPVVEALLPFVRDHLDQLPNQVAAFDRAAQAETPGAAAAALLEGLVGVSGRGPETVAGATASLRDAPGLRPLLIALSLRWDKLADLEMCQILLFGLDALVKERGADSPSKQYSAYFPKKHGFANQINCYNHVPDVNQRAELCEIFAREAKYEPTAATGQQIALHLYYIQQYFAGVPFAALVADREDSKGLVSSVDPRAKNKTDPGQILYALLGQVGHVVGQEAHVRETAVRLAIDLAQTIARMDGQHEIPYARILADYVAAFQPAQDEKLALAAGAQTAVELRAQGKIGIERFLAAHSDLPRELALTAGLHLSPEQLGWLKTKMASIKGRDTQRQLRDVIFGLVTAGRLDLLEAIRATALPSKVLSKTLQLIAHEYRNGGIAQVPFDPMIQALNEGKDPVADVKGAAIEGTLANLPIEGPITPEGTAALAVCAEAIRNLLQQCVPGNMVDGFDTGRNKVPFERALQSVASGTWPAPKYETEIGKRLLAILTPEAQAIWRQETVMREGDAQPVAGQLDARYTDVPFIAAGLKVALDKIVIGHPRLPGLAYDARSIQRLRALIDELKREMQRGPKGGAAHKDGVEDLRLARDMLSLVELKVGLENAPADPLRLLIELKSQLTNAASVLSRLGFVAAYEIASDLSVLSPKPAAVGRSGRYAIDEDNLDSLLTSTVGGCIHHANVRRWANINLAVNANEKIARVYDNDGQFMYRACLKILEATLPNGYHGPVMWVNGLNVANGGTADHRKLMYELLVAKAAAMKIPLVAAHCLSDLPANLGGPIANAEQVTYHVDPGETGTIFTDYVMTTDVQGNLGPTGKMDNVVASYVKMPA